MDPEHAFPDAADELAGVPEPGSALEVGPEPAEADPVTEDDAGDGAEPAVVPAVGGLLVAPPPELPPAQPVTVRDRQTMAVIPLTNWVARMEVTTLHSRAAGLSAIVSPRPGCVNNFPTVTNT